MALNCRAEHVRYLAVLHLTDGSTRSWTKSYETLAQAVESLLPLIDEFGRENIEKYSIYGESHHVVTLVDDSDEPEYIVLDSNEQV